MEEIWKDIADTHGLYQVSNMGRIRAVPKRRLVRNGYTAYWPGQIIKPHLSNSGYFCVHFYVEDKTISRYIHRLVAKAFIPNPFNLPQINHKNEDKLDNRISNLEWCDCKYNNNYGTHTERSSWSTRQCKTIRHHVAMISDDVIISVFNSIQEASVATGIDDSAITKVCYGRPKFYTAGGYVWRFINDEFAPKPNIAKGTAPTLHVNGDIRDAIGKSVNMFISVPTKDRVDDNGQFSLF